MDGLLLKLVHFNAARPEPRFWDLFATIRRELDRLFWCFEWQPWMGAPPGFDEDDAIEGQEATGRLFWPPGRLSRYADAIGEEFLDFWAVEPERDDLCTLMTSYATLPWARREAFVNQHAHAWLIYTKSTCWEIYARTPVPLRRLADGLARSSRVEVHASRSDCRGSAFRNAGLSEVWEAMEGR